ncbi:tetratricopeptide repeat protein [Geomobilimonas luticola]|uniref:Tetratricopeptide repeat protein n=1 Tax=Geomobilimonas luticola TaxID=1114878 RepID=A0ABS5SGR3_9BACT|nr:tetratricopeptide repeat protein [Geomobilimonas luticola]MBT0653776.1 tetratricopeptide repeat protein [Geomobilimonas luticola]
MQKLADIPRLYLFLALLGVTLLVYGNTFRNDWTYDDRYVVVDNPDTHSLAEFARNQYPGRPVRELSYMVDYKLFGTNPAGYHAQQLFWHGLNGCLLLAVFLKLGVGPLPAFLGVLLFLLHPLQVESVANVGHRKELLALFFSLTAFLWYMKGMASGGRSRVLFVVLATLACAGALLSNVSTAFMPLILVLYEYLFVPAERRFLLHRPLLLACAAMTLLGTTVYHYRGMFSATQLMAPYTKNGFTDSLDHFPYYMGALKVVVLYAGKILMPLNLAPEYAIRFSSDRLQPGALAGAALLVLLVFCVVWNASRQPLLTFAGGWFLLMYLPVANIVPISYMMADRYMYTCLPGIALLASWVLERWHSKALVAGSCSLLLVLALLTVRQNRFWLTEHTLWRHAVQVNPDSSYVQSGVADSYILTGDFATARDHLRKALELNRFNLKAYLTLGRVEDMLGNPEAALKNYEIFQAYGDAEFPVATAQVRNYLPYLREKVRRLSGQK